MPLSSRLCSFLFSSYCSCGFNLSPPTANSSSYTLLPPHIKIPNLLNKLPSPPPLSTLLDLLNNKEAKRRYEYRRLTLAEFWAASRWQCCPCSTLVLFLTSSFAEQASFLLQSTIENIFVFYTIFRFAVFNPQFIKKWTEIIYYSKAKRKLYYKTKSYIH